MSKRQSLGSQKNTILNYFASPKAKKPATEAKENIEINENKSNVEKIEKIEKIGPETSEVEDDDETITVVKKRKKISAIIDSDTDEDRADLEQISARKPATKKAKTSKKPLTSDSSENEVETPTEAPHHLSGTPKSKRSLKDYSYKKTATPSKGQVDGDECRPSTSTPTSRKPIKVADHGTASNWLHNRLEFLKPENVRDANKRRPTDADYDARTLHVPREFLDKQTPAMRQWWVMKSTHYDTVLFFKVGKFYELYHMDAVVGVTQLGFTYMKGDFAHSGFPESAYHKMVNALIEKGYKVGRTEQTETPDMMSERCKSMKKVTKFDRVVNREICQISSKAACFYNAQYPESMHKQSIYMYGISMQEIKNNEFRIGICFVDTSIGVINLAEFDDDKYHTKLLATFSENPPGLFLIQKRKILQELKDIFKYRYGDVRIETLAPDTQFYSDRKTIEKLQFGDYFVNDEKKIVLPQVLQEITDADGARPEFKLAVSCLGACVWYLEHCHLDLQVISQRKFQLYNPLNVNTANEIDCMILDAGTMAHLNLLDKGASLMRTLDNCSTAFGKRLLRQWICRPLYGVARIEARQQAVKELYDNPSLLDEAMGILKTVPDIERIVAKIHAYGNKFIASNHPDSRAILYELATYSKRQITDLVKTLKAFEHCKSSLLRNITRCEPEGMNVDLREVLKFFEEAFNQEQAQREGKILPMAGVDENYDQVQEEIREIKVKLDEYLRELQRTFGCKVSYFGSDKKRFQIEIPEEKTKKISSEFQMEGSRKGYKRYSTPQSRTLLAEMLRAESEKAKVINDLNRRVFEKFSMKQDQWLKSIKCLSILDVLCSLATYRKNFALDICMPQIQPISAETKLKIENGRHPFTSIIKTYIPNDTEMGSKDHPNILLLTGPNMGGKTTLMRQVALIAIMAQMGSYVPAKSVQLSLIDRIFTRIGASDDIVAGRSTFMVEMAEASAILAHATRNSLVLLDELGRGTSTHDGNAIATAYVRKLAALDCRTLFATHYHTLVDRYVAQSGPGGIVQLGHMTCLVEENNDENVDEDDDETGNNETVTFLYKMAVGRCPKSFGFNVARLAGLPAEVVKRARKIANILEGEARNRRQFVDVMASSDVNLLRGLVSKLTI